jgi:hypothetical protein
MDKGIYGFNLLLSLILRQLTKRLALGASIDMTAF